jgi:hypothetical protein
LPHVDCAGRFRRLRVRVSRYSTLKSDSISSSDLGIWRVSPPWRCLGRPGLAADPILGGARVEWAGLDSNQRPWDKKFGAGCVTSARPFQWALFRFAPLRRNSGLGDTAWDTRALSRSETRPASWSRPPERGWPWISSVRLMGGERAVGVFGLFEGRPDDTQRHSRISALVRSRCFDFWSRAARRPPISP